MSNHAWAVFSKNVDLAVLAEILHEHADERFPGLLQITVEENGILVKTPENNDFGYWLESPRRLEWRHELSDVEWWLKNYIGHYMARNFQPNCVIRDSGISNTMKPTFDLDYPTVTDWIEAKGKGLPRDVRDFLISRGLGERLKDGTYDHPERDFTSAAYWTLPQR